ncbi:ATP-binding protein [Streptomyces lancefieldiae]|uniref:ATP-binding protein n=1 Tax=Streptomyces lancefieldiae TaxID=3075520 RepID=A0ABU3B0Y6_9ACTN|nr:ATP-binding protein [Streptomyces sp. DSM 40712]MDT0616114.1 ATP-binding protein [Streptomyces sp. DSM 40712]
MYLAEQNEGHGPLAGRPVAVRASFEGGSAEIAGARDMARGFLASLQTVHGLPVSARAVDTVQLVVSELVTNARRYAQGPCLLELELCEGVVRVHVWDSSTTLPSVPAADPDRIGQHGLEIVTAVCQSFCVHREPVGKRITAAVTLADAPGGDITGRQAVGAHSSEA